MPGNTPKYPGAAVSINDLTVATNRASTTLTSGIDNVVTTIPVAATALFTAPCILYIEAEAIYAGSKTSNSFTSCVRGFDNTTAANHATSVIVENLIAAYHFNQPAAEIIAIEADLKTGLPSVRGGTDQVTAPANQTLVGNGTTFGFQPYEPALIGDVTTVAQGTVTTLANIPADTPASRLLVTNVVAPSTPASGKTEMYVDSTQKILSAKNDAGSISVTVVPATGTGSQVVTGIAASGSLTFGTMTTGGTPQFVGGDVTSTASGSPVLHLVSIPDATPAVGSFLVTNVVAPSTPASNKTSVYVDSTDKNLKVKNDLGVITVTVVPFGATVGTFVTGLTTAGSFILGTASSGSGATISPVTATAGTFLTGVNTGGTFTVGTALTAVSPTSGVFITGVTAAGSFAVGTAITPVTATAGTFLSGVNASGTFTVGTSTGSFALTPVTATAGTFITGANAGGTFTVGTALTAVTGTAGTFLSAVTAAGVFSVATALTSANYQTLDTAGTPLTQRPSLNFIAGTGITVLASDNSGSSRTDLSFSQAAKTVKQFISYKGAIAQSGVATLGFSVGTATASAPTAAVQQGSNNLIGVAVFSANSAVQDHFILPSDWTSTIDADIYWTSTDTTGNAIWSMALGKALAGTDTVDQAFNSATLGTSTVNGTASVLNKTTLTGLTTTGLAADNECFFKLLLSSTTMSGGVANLTSLRITLRRSY